MVYSFVVRMEKLTILCTKLPYVDFFYFNLNCFGFVVNVLRAVILIFAINVVAFEYCLYTWNVLFW